ncbi:HEAT repeat domain-containing protein [Streptomyces sp. NBC_01462]|uniref:HEAT repeat domain-containing protein n=1 Tax=Streptomyces sp. NBC_01462 TaxID=2903876 RepID=UPI002E3249CB|nr:HEAT repeat domain-containing protein [Streptomyces sp. NBC_01462]
MPASQHELTNRLAAAVSAKDSDTVGTLLGEGADPQTPGPDGLPLLCTAVAGFDYETAGALTDGGADPDRVLPDGSTPLLRAVDLGSLALVQAVLGDDPKLRLTENTRKRLLDLARYWIETGAEQELRRRTGASSPAVRRLVTEDHTEVEEISLGGLTVRASHNGILTCLEWRFGILTPVAELVARAVPYADGLHANWSEARFVLSERQGPQVWSELKALQHHPDPIHRLFLADVVWSRNSMTWYNHRQDVAEDAEFLAAWAHDEPDSMVLAKVLEVYADEEHPDQEAIGLRHVDHPDPRVRSQVPYLIGQDSTPTEAATNTLLALSRDPDPDVRHSVAGTMGDRSLTTEFRDALLTLIRDTDFQVRARAAISLGNSDDRTAAVTDALVAVLDEEDLLLRLEIVYALARRDDPRTAYAWERVGELPPGFGEICQQQEDHRILAYWNYQSRNRPTEPHSPST